MSHFLTIPINENGIILDQRFKEELQMAATDPFGFSIDARVMMSRGLSETLEMMWRVELSAWGLFDLEL